MKHLTIHRVPPAHRVGARAAAVPPARAAHDPTGPTGLDGTVTGAVVEPGEDLLAPLAGPRATAARAIGAALRLSLGWVFLWAFLDKTFGLGHETAGPDAWVRGGSPTEGFLGFATAGPFAGAYRDLAGLAWVDALFMLGLLGIGAALLLGVAMRVAAGSGALLLVLMWTAVLPPANNPFMDDHLVYAALLVLLAVLGAGRWYGLGARWERLALVRRQPWLR